MNLFKNPRVTLLITLALVAASLFVVIKRPPTLGLDLSGGTRLTIEAIAPKGTDSKTVLSSQAMDSLYLTIQKRVDKMGVSEAIVQRSGENRLIVEIPGEQDPERAKQRIGKTGFLEFKRLDAAKKDWISSGVSGRDLQSADVAPDQGSGWVISFQLTGEGAQKFKTLTEELSVDHQPLGIFFDGQMESAPSVHSVIPNGSGQISGSFTYDEAKLVSDTLNAGALPMDIAFIEEATVGPLLGEASINQSIFAGSIGLGFVLLFMLAYYRIQGFVANIALIIYTLLTYCAYNLLGVTFTLAGIAGFILSIGMAVDANILIFERTKEEIKSGRSLGKAIELGFDRAFPSIFDSNTTTVITCLLLWLLGTGSVKGFAITLAVGVLVSMFSAITVTRTIMQLMFSNNKTLKNPALFGIKLQEIAAAKV